MADTGNRTEITRSDPPHKPYPARVARPLGAAIVTREYFPVSPRTLEAWPLTWRRVNGRALVETDELLAVAKAKLDAAVPVRGGRCCVAEFNPTSSSK